MYENRFTKWMRWCDRDTAQGINGSGIYICAISEEDISGKNFSWITDIVYDGTSLRPQAQIMSQ